MGILPDGEVDIPPYQHAFDSSFDAIARLFGNIRLDSGNGVFIQGNRAWKGIGLSVNQGLVGVLLANIVEPTLGLGHAIVLIKEINGIAQKVAVALRMWSRISGCSSACSS